MTSQTPKIPKTDLSTRVEQALASPALPSVLPSGQTASTLVTFRLWCSATGKASNVIAERKGHTLLLLRNEEPIKAGQGYNSAPPPLLGKFDFKDAGWPGCAHCGAKYNFRKRIGPLWLCDKEICGRPLHCAGERGGGLMRCACGFVDDFDFVSVPRFEVRGAHVGNTGGPNNALSHSPSRQLTSAKPQLPYKGR